MDGEYSLNYGRKKITKKQAEFAKFVEELKQKGIRGEEYRTKIMKWSNEHQDAPTKQVLDEKKNIQGVFPHNSPYHLYPQQQEFVRDIKNITGNGGILIAEACNGFGKTICALYSLLYLDRRIIYVTRTHDQARQVINEIEKINKKVGITYRSVHLASRDLLCINDRYSKLKTSDNLEETIDRLEFCRVLQKNKKCNYQWDINNLPSELPLILSKKELIEYGKNNNICPYFLARKAVETFSVIVAPYQYVFDPIIRKSIDLKLNGRTLVFDEAHNADDIALDILSDTLSDKSLNQAKKELSTLGKTIDFLGILKDYLEENIVSDEPVVKSGESLYQDLMDVLKVDSLSSLERSYSDIVEEIRIKKFNQGKYTACSLNGILRFLSLVNASSKESYVAIYHKSSSGLNMIEYRCLDPSLAIKPVVEKVNGVLVMSGTLPPLNLFKNILGLPNAEIRTYSTIAKPENIRLLIDSSVSTIFSERGEGKLEQYGEKIVKILEDIPNGTLIFFVSKEYMYQSLEKWQMMGLIEQLDGLLFAAGKRVFVEGDKRDNEKVVKEYKKMAKMQGAVLCGVFRGRNAEGSNFPNEEARGIILVGVPYAPPKNPRVKAQKAYFNRKEPGLGEQWYVMDAFKAANQAIGRGIRHKDDWCSFFLMDKRYLENHEKLSSWSVSSGIQKI